MVKMIIELCKRSFSIKINKNTQEKQGWIVLLVWRGYDATQAKFKIL